MRQVTLDECIKESKNKNKNKDKKSFTGNAHLKWDSNLAEQADQDFKEDQSTGNAHS